MQVLIAEDDRLSRLLLETSLAKWGYDVVTTQTGTEVWERLQEPNAPRLVILDWVMPGMDGIEVCRRLRLREGGDLTYAILLTSRDNRDDIVTGLQAGANDYVTKPFDTHELQARVDAGRRVVELQSALATQLAELQDAHTHIKTLQGLLPICAHCHKIRDDQEVWQRLEDYISDRSEASFTHGFCPECLEEHYLRPCRERAAAAEQST